MNLTTNKQGFNQTNKVEVSQPCPTLCDPMNYTVHEFSRPDPGVGSLSLIQGIFPTQGSNPGLLYCRQILYQLIHKGSPRILEWVAYPFFRRSSQSRNQPGVSCIAGGFFTTCNQGSPRTLEGVAYPFFRGSSQPRS